MDWEHRILARIANDQADRVARKTISCLQKLDSTLSGDDSGLVNVWDEVCAQVQFEESWYWESYLQLTRSTIKAFIDTLSKNEIMAIWLQTDEYIDWLKAHDENSLEEPLCSEDAVVYFILDRHLLTKAESWSNKRIRKYLSS